MIVNPVKMGVNTKDATIVPHDVGKDKVAYGSDGKIVGISPFVFDEERECFLPASAEWYSVTFGNGRFIAIAYNSNIVAYSDDGITWTQTTLPAKANWYSVTFGNNRFVAVAMGTIAADSNDGITWTQTTLPSSTNWNSVTFGNGKFIAIAWGSNIAAYSDDGITWTQTTLTSSTNWTSVTFGNGRFVAIVIDSSIVAYSDDGITWTIGKQPYYSIDGYIDSGGIVLSADGCVSKVLKKKLNELVLEDAN